MLLAVVTDETRNDDEVAIVYLFSSILNRTEGGDIPLPNNVNFHTSYSNLYIMCYYAGYCQSGKWDYREEPENGQSSGTFYCVCCY